jgi:hypothetical protein
MIPKDKDEKGFVFAITVLAVSFIVGLIVIFLYSTVTLETTIASRSAAAQVAYWKALSKIRMVEQVIADYGLEGTDGILTSVEFIDIDECNKKAISTVYVGDYYRSVEVLLENLSCEEQDDHGSKKRRHDNRDKNDHGGNDHDDWDDHNDGDDHNDNDHNDGDDHNDIFIEDVWRVIPGSIREI